MNQIVNRLKLLLLMFLLVGSVHAAAIIHGVSTSKQIAFPGAEGCGKYTIGGRGGKVIHVTNLNDSGKGSLRAALDKEGPRTIVFDVSGTIALKSELRVTQNDFTLAGQSAPGDGICVGGYPVVIDADNVIIRYMRFRLGDANKVEGDAMSIRNQKNILIDHCSFSWATDECASLYEMHESTVQWCIISEALNNSVHRKGEHGYGGIWGGVNVTFHHNLFASNSSRNPRFNGSRYDVPWTDLVDFRNNVIYNWKVNSTYAGEKARQNMVANYYKPGPATPPKMSHRIFNVFRSPDDLPFGEFYIADNYMYGNEEVSTDNWNGGVDLDEGAELDKVKSEKPFPFCPIEQETAVQAFQSVLKFSGASFMRDAVDQRIVKEVETGTVTFRGSRDNLPGIIDSQADVGGYPELKSKPAPRDSDGDGMPDAWEIEKGLNPDNASDGSAYKLSDDYTNIEVYLNELVEAKDINADFVIDQSGEGDFKTIQEAINAVPDFRKNETVIFIKNGIYKEKLVLPISKRQVTFVGEDKMKTIITYDDYAQKKNIFGEEIGTTGSSGFFIFADKFKAENITFENSAGPVGQAVAVRITGDKIIFNNCRFLGNQDTLYPQGDRSRQYYKDCYIEGTVDFIFGWSIAVFENCEIFCKKSGYVTAASTLETNKYGFVFLNCNITGDADDNTFYLGRPWRPYANVVYLNCKLGAQIKAEGWNNWGKKSNEETAFYAEYKNTGAGAKSTDRVAWSHQLTDEEADQYNLENIFGAESVSPAFADDWMPEF